MAALRIRQTTVIAKGDALLVGNVLVIATELGSVWWEATMQKVLVSSKCHADNIPTDCSKADWDAYVAALP